MRLTNLLAVAALAAAALTGCAAQHDTAATRPAPVLAAQAVPAGMSSYRYASTTLDVTLPAQTGVRAAAAVSTVVDALARYPVTLLLDVDPEHRQHLHATWVKPAVAGAADQAKRAALRAQPRAEVAVTSRVVVGLRWQATAAGTQALPAGFARGLQTALTAAVPGRYTIGTTGRTVTVTWVGAGLTPAGAGAVQAVVATAAGVHPPAVTLAPLR